jgi:hypothetical protein
MIKRPSPPGFQRHLVAVRLVGRETRKRDVKSLSLSQQLQVVQTALQAASSQPDNLRGFLQPQTRVGEPRFQAAGIQKQPRLWHQPVSYQAHGTQHHDRREDPVFS